MGCDDRFENLKISKTLTLCTLLDPRYKHHIFINENTVITVKNLATDLVTGLIKQKRLEGNPLDDNSDNESEAVIPEKKVSVWDDVEEIISKVKPKTNALSLAIQEVILIALSI